VSTVRIENITE